MRNVYLPTSVSEWLLFKIKWTIFSYIIARTCYISMKWWWCLLLTKSNTFNWIYIVLVHWHNSLRVNMSPHSNTLSCFHANQSFCSYSLMLHSSQVSSKYQFSSQGSNLWYCTLTITPSMQISNNISITCKYTNIKYTILFINFY
jgi:hypothetical protein